MIRTITVGMTLELTNPINHAPYHVRVTALPTEDGGKYTVVNINSGKEKQLSLAAIGTARRYKIPATKGPTVVSSALAVLTKENKPMTVAEISAAILQTG